MLAKYGKQPVEELIWTPDLVINVIICSWTISHVDNASVNVGNTATELPCTQTGPEGVILYGPFPSGRPVMSFRLGYTSNLA